MKLLLDTHVLLWALMAPDRLTPALRAALEDPATQVLFSAASIWEVAIKRALDRPTFLFEPEDITQAAREAPFSELPIVAGHAEQVRRLPSLHTDPFDRMLIAQAVCEGALLVTADDAVARYPAPVRRVGDF